MSQFPDAKSLLKDRPGIIPQVPEWNTVKDAILAANEKSLTSCRVCNLPDMIAESIAYCLTELGYNAVAYYQFQSKTNRLRDIDIHWRQHRPAIHEAIKAT